MVEGKIGLGELEAFWTEFAKIIVFGFSLRSFCLDMRFLVKIFMITVSNVITLQFREKLGWCPL